VAWTYDSTALGTALAQVRSRIGDTDSDRPLLTDEEIAVMLTAHGQAVLAAACSCIQLILAKIARDVDTSHAGVSANRDQKTQHYKDLLESLQADLDGENVRQAEIHYTGAVPGDLDYEAPKFRLGRDRYD
jgi:hypothetical protein